MIPFSIIIPTYNRAHVLRRAIDSVLSQSYQDFEIVVVDDGSTDQTKQLIISMANDKIGYYYQTNGGVSKARNLGTWHAKGRYLIFLDSDDEMNSHYLSEVSEQVASSPSIIFVGVEIAINGQFLKAILPKLPYGKLSDRGLYLAGSFVIERSLFLKIGGYDEALRYSENTELSLRLLQLNTNRIFIDKILFRYNQAKARESSSPQNVIDSSLHILNKHDKYFQSEKEIKRLFLQILGVSFLRLNQTESARKYLWEAYLLMPFQIKSLLRLMITYVPFFSRKLYSVEDE